MESTLVTVGRPSTDGQTEQSRWHLLSAGFLLLVLLLLTGMGIRWDIAPLAPLLFRSTAAVTLVPTHMDRQTTLVLTAVTGTPDVTRHEVAARFVSATSPVLMTSGQATGVEHVQVVTDAPACIPAGNPPLFGIVTVSAHALQVGSRGNIAVLDVDGLCCAAGVAVKNTAGFRGGQDAQTYPTVRQVDIDGLMRPLLDTLTQGATFGVRSQLRPQEWMVALPACVPAIRADHAVGSRATTVTVTVKVACQSEVYDQHAALRLAAISFTRGRSASLGANFALVSRMRTTLVGVTVTDPKRGTLALSTRAEGVWVYQWSLAHLQALARQIAGVRKRDARAFLLREEGVQNASMLLSGREQTTLPADPSRITITVAGEQTASDRNR